MPDPLPFLVKFLRSPACEAAVLAYNGRKAVELAGRLFAIPLGQLLE